MSVDESTLQVETVQSPEGPLVLTVAGEIDVACAKAFEFALLRAVEETSWVIVDLSALEFIDSSGLSGLHVAGHEAKRRGTRIAVVCPETNHVRKVLQISGIEARLAVAPSWQAAIDATSIA